MPAAVETMAYTNEVPWHGLGAHLSDANNIDLWKKESGTDWEAITSPVYYAVGEQFYFMEDKVVIYRNDTHEDLGVVGANFKIVQPGEILEFFRDLVELGHFTMETAGVLFGGRRIWALARATEEAKLDKVDVIKPYLFLATGLDGTLATHASFTTIRVVCNNTLQMALNATKDDRIRVTHRNEFNEEEVKTQLGLVDQQFTDFMDTAETLASIEVTEQDARDVYSMLFLPENFTIEQSLDSRVVNSVMEARLNYPGQDTFSAKGTAWGLVNGVTAYLDHLRNTQTIDARLNDAWLGAGRNIKAKAVKLALEL